MNQFLKSLPVLGFLLKLAERLRWKFHMWKVDPSRLLQRYLRGQKNLFLLQIGSNDGLNGDPIFAALKVQSSWKALLVEPVPYLFGRLKQNYDGNNRVQFANVAIAEEATPGIFYYLDASAKLHFPDLPSWFDQLGSFDRNHIIKHLGVAMEPFIRTLDIPTVSLPSLLEQHEVSQIDVLHIDTEGYDWKILRQLNLKKFRPKLILFEYKHLQEAERLAAMAFLKPAYRITDLDVSGDYLCERIRGI
jgi:FkbM family methyltransferase